MDASVLATLPVSTLERFIMSEQEKKSSVNLKTAREKACKALKKVCSIASKDARGVERSVEFVTVALRILCHFMKW
jgi:hypothetical protein